MGDMLAIRHRDRAQAKRPCLLAAGDDRVPGDDPVGLKLLGELQGEGRSKRDPDDRQLRASALAQDPCT